MSLNFTVREVTGSHIVVDYSDGSNAVIPLYTSDNKLKIERRIKEYSANRFETTVNLEDVPFSVGETGQVKTSQELEAEELAQLNAEVLTYADLRRYEYPSIGDQLDAAYWARHGDTSKQEEIDAEILAVKTSFPKDMEPLTRADYLELVGNE